MQDLKRFTVGLSMNGAATQQVEVPGGFLYVSVINNTPYTVSIYRGSTVNASDLVITVPRYSIVTVPVLAGEQRQGYLLSWTGTGAAAATVIFTDQSLYLNQSLLQPSALMSVSIDQTTPGTTNAVAIDQTTPGTTNKVVAGIDQVTANANEVVVKSAAAVKIDQVTANANEVVVKSAAAVKIDQVTANANEVVVKSAAAVKIDQVTANANEVVVKSAVPDQAATTNMGTSAANTAQTITRAGVAGQKHYVCGVAVRITGAAVGAAVTIEVKDNGTTIYADSIPNGAAEGSAIRMDFPRPLVSVAANTDMTVDIAAAGALAVSTGTLIAYTK